MIIRCMYVPVILLYVDLDTGHLHDKTLKNSSIIYIYLYNIKIKYSINMRMLCMVTGALEHTRTHTCYRLDPSAV